MPVPLRSLGPLVHIPSGIVEPDLFLQAVPRTLVHRAAVSEVLMTGLRVQRRDSFRLGAQWPRGHSFYGPVERRWHDPMLVAETIRQAGLLASHSGLGVPLSHQFLTHDMAFNVTLDGLALSDRPADIIVELRCSEFKRRRGGALAGCLMEADFLRDGIHIGSARTRMSCLPRPAYERLRGGRHRARPAVELPAPVVPELVGRVREEDVVLGAGLERVWTLRADGRHPVLFDHPTDHLPGMVVMEAARQAAQVVLRRPKGIMVDAAFDFHRYVEHETPCLVTVESVTKTPGGNDRVGVRFDQGGRTVAEGRVDIAPTGL